MREEEEISVAADPTSALQVIEKIGIRLGQPRRRRVGWKGGLALGREESADIRLVEPRPVFSVRHEKG